MDEPAHALGFPKSYYDDLATLYGAKRDQLLGALKDVGFKVFHPEGAYYIMTDASELMALSGQTNDVDFAHWMIREIGVATVPGSSFYLDKRDGATKVRFCYCKKPETLQLASDLMVEGFARLRAGKPLPNAGGAP